MPIFLLAPGAAAPCASSACSGIHKHHFLPRQTFKVLCVLVQSERVEPYRDLVQYCRVEIFAQPLFPAPGDDRDEPSALTHSGPTRSATTVSYQLLPDGGPPQSADHHWIIFLLMTSNVLSIFLLTPSAAAPCASSACLSISTISF